MLFDKHLPKRTKSVIEMYWVRIKIKIAIKKTSKEFAAKNPNFLVGLLSISGPSG